MDRCCIYGNIVYIDGCMYIWGTWPSATSAAKIVIYVCVHVRVCLYVYMDNLCLATWTAKRACGVCVCTCVCICVGVCVYV